MTSKNMLQLALMALMVVLMTACSGQKQANYPYETKYLPVMLQGSSKWSLLDVGSGEIVAKDAFDAAPSAVISDMFFVPQPDGTFSYYNVADVKKPVATGFGSASEFSVDGYAVASKRGGKITIIDKKCQVVAELPDTVVQCDMFCRGLAVFTAENGKSGYVNTQGHVMVPAIYDQANSFQLCDEALVLQRHEQDSLVDVIFINNKGEKLFSTNNTVYTPLAQTFTADIIPVQKRDTVVCLNPEGKEVANPFAASDTIKNAGFANGTRDGVGNYIVVKGDKMGVVDDQCKTLLPIKYLDIIDVCPDRYLVSEKAGLYYLADKTGKPVGSAKIANANGGPGGVAQRGYVDPAVPVSNIMGMFDEQSFGGINGQTTVANFYQQLDAEHPEAYAGQNVLTLPTPPIGVVFAGPVASQIAPSNYTFNMNTPVTAVTFDYNASAYSTDTEQLMVDLMAQNMGKNGFVNAGRNVFTSPTSGTAVSIGYGQGVVRLIYWMHAADAKPLPTQARK